MPSNELAGVLKAAQDLQITGLWGGVPNGTATIEPVGGDASVPVTNGLSNGLVVIPERLRNGHAEPEVKQSNLKQEMMQNGHGPVIPGS